MAEYKNATAIKAEIQKICDNCWHPYRLGGCPEHCGINDAVKAIDSAPAVDAVPVRHGRWETDGMMMDECEYLMTRCTACGGTYEYGFNMPFCPNCGARMDGKGNNG